MCTALSSAGLSIITGYRTVYDKPSRRLGTQPGARLHVCDSSLAVDRMADVAVVPAGVNRDDVPPDAPPPGAKQEKPTARRSPCDGGAGARPVVTSRRPTTRAAS